MDIPGLYLYLDVVSVETEREILDWLDDQSWSYNLSRRTQQYGFEYNYSAKSAPLTPTTQLSGPILQVAQQLKPIFERLGSRQPDQCIVNEYTRGQGINGHIDSPKFGPVVASLSLNAPTNFILTDRQGNSKELDVPTRSLLVLSGEARTDWKHEIPKRASVSVNGQTVPKAQEYRRVSLTYRTS